MVEKLILSGSEDFTLTREDFNNVEKLEKVISRIFSNSESVNLLTFWTFREAIRLRERSGRDELIQRVIILWPL